MKKIYYRLLEELEKGNKPVLATIIGTKGSVPQVPGASALFSEGILLAGTLGGGVLEGDATRKAGELQAEGTALVYKFDLNADISDKVGAICGGSAIILMDANTVKNRTIFNELESSIGQGKPGILASRISINNNEAEIERFWFEAGKIKDKKTTGDWNAWQEDMKTCLENGHCLYLENQGAVAIFLEPVYPIPKLIIAGAGHVGRALAHMANFLDFEVTVIDDRSEYANPGNIPDADHIVVDQVGKALRKIPKTPDTYVVIVTRGHRDDAEALKACINADLPYLGMIGSRKKIRLMHENFVSKNWATESEWERLHAPVGLEIGSATVQEIALSIAAQLVQVRNKVKTPGKSPNISAIILAAGSSSRMGKPKMLIPFSDSSIIETVIDNVSRSKVRKIVVVLGADSDAISKVIQDYTVETAYNNQHEKGMLSSVQCGLKSLPVGTQAAMVLLGDQPMIGSEVMDLLISSYIQTGKEIIVATADSRRGHPILIGSKYFQEISGYSAEQSLKDLIDNHPEDILEVETGFPEILRDIDTESDYKKELNLYKHDKNN